MVFEDTNVQYSRVSYMNDNTLLLKTVDRKENVYTVVSPSPDTIVTLVGNVVWLRNAIMGFRYSIAHPDEIGASSAFIKLVEFIHGINPKEEM